jgi:CHAD domain-containing protein
VAFQLKADESVGKGVRRIARKQLDAALDELAHHPSAKRDEVVHEVRKRFKKVRAVLRLVRDQLGDKVYQRENDCFRDARDATVLVDTLDELADRAGDEVPDKTFDTVRKELQAGRRAVRKRVQDVGAFAEIAEAVTEARKRLKKWPLARGGWTALGGGLRRVYRSGRRAFAAADKNATVENFHEWRKQAKYLRHQLEVLEPVWPKIMADFAAEVHELTDLLGDDHDLAVLRQALEADPDRFGGSVVLAPLFRLIDHRCDELRASATGLGRRIYSDSPGDFAARLADYWHAWREEARAARVN